MRGWILSVKIVAASAAVFSLAVTLQLAAPPVTEFVTAEAPRLYKSFAAWLVPPYLYFIINGIIISIAATSRFQKTMAPDHHSIMAPTLIAPPPSFSTEPDLTAPTEYISKVAEDSNLSLETELEEGFVISRSSWSPRKRESSENVTAKSGASGTGGVATDKPPVSARLGRRKSIKASPEGKALRVTRPRKHDTLESTWRTITDGRPVPLARHLKKSDTWDSHARVPPPAADRSPPAMHKSESISVPPYGAGGSPAPDPASGESSLPSGKIRRVPSLGRDDLNRRVEAFIKKFNEEMRLQRQESLQQYMDVINHSGQ